MIADLQPIADAVERVISKRFGFGIPRPVMVPLRTPAWTLAWDIVRHDAGVVVSGMRDGSVAFTAGVGTEASKSFFLRPGKPTKDAEKWLTEVLT